MNQIHICSHEPPRSSIQGRGCDFYVKKIGEIGYGFEFGKLEAVSTAGDIRPPYAYQWRATNKHRPGDDDDFEGLGGSPVEALRALCKEIQDFIENYVDEEDEELEDSNVESEPKNTTNDSSSSNN